MDFCKNGAILAGTIVFFSLPFSGCDKLPNLGDYFSSKPKTPTTQSPSSAMPGPTSVPGSMADRAKTPASAANVLISIGDWTITIDDFKQRVQALKEAYPDFNVNDTEQVKLVLEELIRQELLVQDAEKKGLGQDKDIATAVTEFRRTLLIREDAVKIVKDVQPVTDQEAQAYYNDPKNDPDFVEPTKYNLREIVVKTEAEAKQVLADLYNGSDFNEMVKKSIGKSVAKNGVVENIEFEKMDSVVATLDTGGISSVFPGPEGYYIVKLEGKTGGGKLKYEGIKDELKNVLTIRKQQQEILDYLKKLREQTTVIVNDKLLEDIKSNEPRK